MTDPASAQHGNLEADVERGADRSMPIHLEGAFGRDRSARLAESFARYFGTPRFVIWQTVAVAVWIALNAAAFSLSWDPYPFVLLNLAFSTQAALAAPLILLTQTRQADRDRARSEAANAQHELEVAMQDRVLADNNRLIREVQRLTDQILRVAASGGPDPGPPRARRSIASGMLGSSAPSDVGSDEM